MQGVLSSKVDKLVTLDRKTGFTFREEDFKILGNSILQKEEIGSSPLAESKIIPKIAKNSQNRKDELASELKKFRLPNKSANCTKYELLVVVTGIKSEDSLAQANIWRSLSSLVESVNWETVSNKKKEGQKQNFLMAIALILLLVAIAIIIIWILTN